MNNKNVVKGIIAVLAIVLIGYGIYNANKDAGQSDTRQEAGDTASSTATGANPAAKKLSYGEAVNTYKYRFQFSNCSGTPGMISVKKGSPVMLDNRDRVAHTIKANGQTFNIKAQDYAVIYPQLITGADVNLANSNVTCDGGGAATLNVER